MSTQAMSFSGIGPEPNPAPDRGANAVYGDHSRSAITQSRASARSYSQSGLSSCISRTGELDGAEGIDGAEIRRNQTTARRGP